MSFLAILASFCLCGSLLGSWLGNFGTQCSRRRIKMRKDALVALVASAFLVERAYTVVVVGACFAFAALSFKEVLTEQLWISDCFTVTGRA